MSGTVSSWMAEQLQAGKPSRYTVLGSN